MTRLKVNQEPASTIGLKKIPVTEMINALLISKPATTKKEPEVIDLKNM